MKECPCCGELINENAKKCKYCGEWLNKCPYCGELVSRYNDVCPFCCSELDNKKNDNQTLGILSMVFSCVYILFSLIWIPIFADKGQDSVSSDPVSKFCCFFVLVLYSILPACFSVIAIKRKQFYKTVVVFSSIDVFLFLSTVIVILVG